MIANNAFPCIFWLLRADCTAKDRAPASFRDATKARPGLWRVVAAAQRVVDKAISTKSCGQVCGLLIDGPS
jgi:hypothetical protein